MFRRLLLGIGVSCVSFLWMAAPTVFAFSLSPALQEISIKPGTVFTGQVTVLNEEKQKIIYYLSIAKFIPSGESGQQAFLPLSDTTGLPQWLSVEQPSIELKPGERRQVPFSIHVPQDALPGGYYAALFFSSTPPVLSAQGAVVAGARTGELLLVTVEGKVTAALRVASTVLGMPSTTDRLPAMFDVTFENIGNVHAVPQGEVRVKNMFGSTVARLPLQYNQPHVLPGSRRRLLLVWQKETPLPGHGFWHDAKEEWRNFAFGRYTASLETIGAVPPVNEIRWRFSVWPWRLGVCGLGALFVIFCLARLYRRWLLRRILDRAV